MLLPVMSESRPSDTFPGTSPWAWDLRRSQAAVNLASGYTHQATADAVGVSKRTITTWLQNVEFSAEVDRLSLMVDVSSRAERLRIAMRVVRQKAGDDIVDTDRDILDWLKFAQSETDGVKLNLTGQLAAVTASDSSLADSGPDRASDAIERIN